MTTTLRGLRILASVAGTLVLLGMLAIGGLVWRLSDGPLDVTGPARLLAGRFVPDLKAERVTLALQGHELKIAVTALQAGDGGPGIATGSVALAAAPLLLQGDMRPRTITADGVHLQIDRAVDGTFSIKGVASGSPGGDSAFDPASLDTLDHVTLTNATVDFSDAASHQGGQLRGLAIELARDASGALAGHVQSTLMAGDVTSGFSLDAHQLQPGGGIRLQARIGAVNPAAVSQLAPGLAKLAALNATLSVAAEAELTPQFTLRHATLHAEAGPGQVLLPAKGGGTSSGNFAALALDADGDPGALRLSGLRIVLAPPGGAPPTTVILSGEASRSATHAVATLHIGLDRLRMADLGALWPQGVGGGGRAWLVANVVSGDAHDGQFDLKFESGPALDDVTMTAAAGTLPADEVSVYWLRPVPPIEHARALVTVIDPDTLTITATGARQGGVVARQVTMRIWGLSVKDQFSQIDADLAAALPDVLSLLQHPRLKLLSAHPLPMGKPTGNAVSHLTVKLPLENKVDIDSIGIHATSTLSDVGIPALVGSQGLTQGAFTIDVTQDGLSLGGTARLAGFASTVALGMDFRAGPPDQVVQHASVSGSGDERALAKAGLDTIGLLSGKISGKLDYSERRDGHAVLQGSADLGEASLSTPLGWSKPPGPAAGIEARAELDHGRLAGFDELHGDGPGLTIRGRSELVDGWPSILHIERCVIGRTSLAGTIAFPNRTSDALVVALSGAQLDVAGPLTRHVTLEPSTPDAVKPGRPYKVDLHFDRVLLGTKGTGLGPVHLSAAGDDRRIAQAHLVSSGPERVDARIEPRGETRRVVATVGDLGVLLHGLEQGVEVDRGAADLQAEFDDRLPGSPLTGTAVVTRFGIRQAATFGKVLQGMTLYGVLDALRGPGLVFDQLTAPFTLSGPVLELRQARAFSSSLGVTAQGRLDFGRDTVNLSGTIVPAYFFNTLPGRVPLIGKLLSPEPGGGLFAATFSLHGPMADPAVGVNPLATLTPGALRGLFGLFD